MPLDPQKPTVTTGIPLGTPEFKRVGELLVSVLDGLAAKGEGGDPAVEEAAKAGAHELTRRFPIY